ncbi:NAD(P)-dependent alcohol dehydrogenase [Nonomuraea zeae]|uniref:NAD(P)-dependent alcohol dehydrogenase n=1 Tax=Nonomuraea zeae TaxID=1642303 RepID=A0A5S4G3D0_9ACTN|nr:NAD(P)-dependent alcohol dehydrogenase [Nonomuraea zeae]TMR27515.1 NAD(P)-dependent alcohol dehydrogenase [Nonomuraea zeae]
MKAVIRDAYGPADVLRLGEVRKPVPGDDDVLLRVHAAGVDMGVWHLLEGVPYLMRPAIGFRKPKNPLIGNDIAGEVEAVGANVTRFKLGDRVFGTCDGAFAEFVRTPQDRLVAVPEKLTFEQAAALPTSGMTALTALRDAGKVRSGQRVLVIGAGGGVGTFAVQLAKAFGAEVTGVCSTSKVELVRSIGADDIVDYTVEDFADGKRRYDLIVDMASNRSLSHLRRALTPRGTFVIVGGEEGGRWLAGMDRLLRAVLLGPFVRHRPRVVFAFPKLELLETLAELAEQGKVTPVVSKTFPLRQTPEAVRELAKGHARGKMVITVR